MRLRDLVHPSRVLLVAVGLAMLAAGCRSHRADDAKSGPEVIYARAQKAMKNSSYAEAIKQLEALQSRFPFSEPARQSQLDLIYAYYKTREVDPAIDAADTFIRENPTNPAGRLRLLHEGPGVFRAPGQLAGAQIQRRSVAAPAHQRAQVLRSLPAADREISRTANTSATPGSA